MQHYPTQTTKGSPYLREALTQAAWAVSHTKETYLAAQYHGLVRRMGRKKALVAVAHSLLVIVYHVLARQADYRELGATTSTDNSTRRSSSASSGGWRGWG